MKLISGSALSFSAIAVSVCSALLSAYLYYENVGNRWAYLGAALVLAVGWIVHLFSDDRRSVQTSIFLAGVLLLVAMLEKMAYHAGWSTGADIDQRLLGVLLGAVVVALSNAIPKSAESARALAARRTMGWALVLGGLCFALAWLVLPLSIASNAAIIALLAGLAVAVAAYSRWRFVALLVVAALCVTTAQVQARDLNGPWHGSLRVNAGDFGLELLVQRRDDGTLSATLKASILITATRAPVGLVRSVIGSQRSPRLVPGAAPTASV